ncbi:Hypothetical predicted protein [Olea europaea subsp. europaea]|uniref:Uncharacterized protein n=1 Tax=Olea europaea subsp. europaea TaxID=158383 RepID=A0A8S0R746_OLEEU|nr:Hypothetical predicted protein [Olea europaea subsp. europaea]
MEVKIEKTNSEISGRIGAMKFEFQRSMAIMMDKWENMEWGRKDKACQHLLKALASPLAVEDNFIYGLQSKIENSRIKKNGLDSTVEKIQSGEENFSYHCCKKKEMKILLIGKSVVKIEVAEIESDANGKKAIGVVNVAEIFLNIVVGLIAPKMMKEKGEIEQLGVVMMLEGVAILKFIPTDKVQHMEVLCMGTTGTHAKKMVLPHVIPNFAIEPHFHLADKVDFVGSDRTRIKYILEKPGSSENHPADATDSSN